MLHCFAVEAVLLQCVAVEAALHQEDHEAGDACISMYVAVCVTVCVAVCVAVWYCDFKCACAQGEAR